MDISTVTIVSKDRLEIGLLNSRKETVTRKLTLCGITIDATMTAPEVISCAKLFGYRSMVVGKEGIIPVAKLDDILGGCMSKYLPNTMKSWEDSLKMGTPPKSAFPIGMLKYPVSIRLTGTSVLRLNLVNAEDAVSGKTDRMNLSEDFISSQFIRAVYEGMLTTDDWSIPITESNAFDWNSFQFEGMQIRYITDGITAVDMMCRPDQLTVSLKDYASTSGASVHPQRFICFAKIPITDYLEMIVHPHERLAFLYADAWKTLMLQSVALTAPEARKHGDVFNASEGIYLIPDNATVNTVFELNMGTNQEDISEIQDSIIARYRFFRRNDPAITSNNMAIRNIALSGYQKKGEE